MNPDGATPALLPLFPADAFQRVLCVVAHPDDVEYGTSSAVAAWTARGVEVSGEPLERGIASLEAHKEYLAGIPGHPPPRVIISAITRRQGKALATANAVLFRAFDFQAPPALLIEAMQEAAQEG